MTRVYHDFGNVDFCEIHSSLAERRKDSSAKSPSNDVNMYLSADDTMRRK